MKRTALIVFLMVATNMFALPISGDENKNVKDSELVEQLVSMVTSILQGKDYTEFRENISPEAYVINNNSYESIFEVLSNSTKREIFIESNEIIIGFVQLWLPDNQKEAYMVLETKSANNAKVNWHSILFKIGKNQKWQILSWHKS